MSEYYLCAGNKVVGAFSDSRSCLVATVKNFAPGVHIKIKKTHDTGDCIVGQVRGISQKPHGTYRRRLKPGDFTL